MFEMMNVELDYILEALEICVECLEDMHNKYQEIIEDTYSSLNDRIIDEMDAYDIYDYFSMTFGDDDYLEYMESDDVLQYIKDHYDINDVVEFC